MEHLPAAGPGTALLERPDVDMPTTPQALAMLQQEQAVPVPSASTQNVEPARLDQPGEIDVPAPPLQEDSQDLVVGIAGTGHDARLYARDAGHERHLSYLEDESGMRGIARKIWSNVSGGARRNRYNVEARQEIEASTSGNVLMHHGVNDEEWHDMARDTITRFTGEYDDLLDKDAGERRAEISEQDNPNAVELRTAVKGLIKEYANGNLTDESFEEEKKRVLADLTSRGVTQELLGEGATFADNLHDIAKAVVKRIGNERSALSADEVIDNLKFVVGEARIGARTETNKNAVERLAEKLDCKWVNEATVVSALSTAYAIGRWSAQRATGAATRVAGVGLGAGVWAGVRASSESKSERQLLSRERAMGIERDQPAGKLESRLAETLHDSKNAKDIIGDLGGLFDSEGKLTVESPNDIRDVANLLADVRARQRLSGRNKVDLIDYSDIKTSAAERLQLMKLTAQLHTQLATKFGALSNADRRGLDPLGTFDKFMEANMNSAVGTLSGSISEKDALAQRLHNTEFIKAFAKGTLLGAGIGIGAQEIVALALPHLQGAAESLLHHDSAPTDRTLLAGAQGESHNNLINFSGATEKTNLFADHAGNKADVILPKEFSVQKGPDGFTVTSPDGKSVSGLGVGPQGHLTAHSLSELKSIGLDPVDKQPHYTPVEHISSHSKQVSAHEFLKNHQAHTTHVSRIDFANNDTSNPDGNELRLDWGAHNGTDAHGDVVLNMNGMINGESVTAGGHSINPQEALHNGKLSAYISVTRGSQETPFKVNIRPNGSIVIGHNSPLHQLFSRHDGQPHFKGGLIEVAQNNDTTATGVHEITPLATVVGSNDIDKLHDVVQTRTTAAHYQYSFQPTPPSPVESGPDVVVPPVFPFYFRNTLKPRSAAPAAPQAPSARPPANPEPYRRAPRPDEPAEPVRSPERPAPRVPIAELPPTDRPRELEPVEPSQPRTTERQNVQRLAIESAPKPKEPTGNPGTAQTDAGSQKPADDRASASTPPADPVSDTTNSQEAEADQALPEWEDGDRERSAREMALKFGFPFADSLPYKNSWTSATWRRATDLLKQTMANAETSSTANTMMLVRTIARLEQEGSERGEDRIGSTGRSGVDAAVHTLLAEVLSNYRQSRRRRAA